VKGDAMKAIEYYRNRIFQCSAATAANVDGELLEIRDEALEWAARRCESNQTCTPSQLAARIRGDKSKPPAPEHAGCSRCQAAVDTCAGAANSLRIMAEALERVRRA